MTTSSVIHSAPVAAPAAAIHRSCARSTPRALRNLIATDTIAASSRPNVATTAATTTRSKKLSERLDAERVYERFLLPVVEAAGSEHEREVEGGEHCDRDPADAPARGRQPAVREQQERRDQEQDEQAEGEVARERRVPGIDP